MKNFLSNLECFLSSFNLSFPLLYFRFFIVSLLPLLYLAIFLFNMRIWLFIQRKPFKLYIIYSAGLYILFYSTADLFSFIIQLVSCRDINGGSYIVANITHSCYTSQYHYYNIVMVFPTLLVFIIGIPFLFFIYSL